MKWLDDNLPAAIGTALTTFLGALYAGVRILWGRLVTKQDLEISELRAKLEASEARHLKTALTLERLLGKYERERGFTSSRPPKST